MATILDPRAIRTRARQALLATNWWAAAIRGVSAIIIGSFAIFAPALTLIGLVMIFAAYCFVDGVFAIVLAIRGARAGERWGWLAFNGLVSIAAAAAAVFYPGLTVFAFAILLAVWALVSGAATIVAGVELGRSHGRWWLIATGIVAILVAVLIILVPPLALLTLSYAVGFQALLAGFILLALAFRLRQRAVESDWRRGSADSTIAPAGGSQGGAAGHG
jgi:uncharacterized membrane protein HdeD (DUF308 family)